MPKLTKRFLDSVEPKDRETLFWDDELTGFGLRVKPSGTKSFLIQYRNAEGTSKRQTLGRSSVLTAEQARKAAREHLAAVTLGTDPVSDKQKARKGCTVNPHYSPSLFLGGRGAVMAT